MTNKWYLPVCICLKYDDTDHKYNFNIYRAYRSALSKSLFTNTFTSIKSLRPGIWHVRGHTSSVEARLRVNKHYWKKLIVQWVVFSSNSRDWECQWPSKKDIWTFELNRLYLVSLSHEFYYMPLIMYLNSNFGYDNCNRLHATIFETARFYELEQGRCKSNENYLKFCFSVFWEFNIFRNNILFDC